MWRGTTALSDFGNVLSFIRLSHYIAVPPLYHPTVPSSHRRPTVPLSHHPAVPSSHHPAVPSSHHPAVPYRHTVAEKTSRARARQPAEILTDGRRLCRPPVVGGAVSGTNGSPAASCADRSFRAAAWAEPRRFLSRPARRQLHWSEPARSAAPVDTGRRR